MKMRRAWVWLLLWLLAVVVLAKAMPLIVEHYSETDNVRELFRTDQRHVLAPHTWFVLLCLLVPGSATVAARLLLRRRFVWPVVIALGSPVLGWYCLRYAVTVESIHDILGGPFGPWPYDLGYIARFSIVFGTLWTLTLLGFLPGLWVTHQEALRRPC